MGFGKILYGRKSSKGDALPENVLEGKKFSNQKQVDISGTMPNCGEIVQNLNAGGSYTIPVGYHNGVGKVMVNSLSSQTSGNALSEDIVSGKTAWVNGNQISGQIPNRNTPTIINDNGGAIIKEPDGGLKICPQKGLYHGTWNSNSYCTVPAQNVKNAGFYPTGSFLENNPCTSITQVGVGGPGVIKSISENDNIPPGGNQGRGWSGVVGIDGNYFRSDSIPNVKYVLAKYDIENNDNIIWNISIPQTAYYLDYSTTVCNDGYIRIVIKNSSNVNILYVIDPNNGSIIREIPANIDFSLVKHLNTDMYGNIYLLFTTNRDQKLFDVRKYTPNFDLVWSIGHVGFPPSYTVDKFGNSVCHTISETPYVQNNGSVRVYSPDGALIGFVTGDYDTYYYITSVIFIPKCGGGIFCIKGGSNKIEILTKQLESVASILKTGMSSTKHAFRTDSITADMVAFNLGDVLEILNPHNGGTMYSQLCQTSGYRDFEFVSHKGYAMRYNDSRGVYKYKLKTTYQIY